MKIECTIRRDGGSIVTMDEKTYHFKPEQPGGPHVADVVDKAHIARFLAIPEAYTIPDDELEIPEEDVDSAIGVTESSDQEDDAAIQNDGDTPDKQAGESVADDSPTDADDGSDEKPSVENPVAKTGTPRKRKKG